MPVNLRVGKQVINWGESTFILHGNNVFNPIDVGAFRRPGSEIKEALVPVNAVSGSVSLPFDVSISGYYALDWEPFELDPSGTPFSGADIVELGSGMGGNELRGSFLTGSPASGARRNCTPLANANSATFTVQQPLNALLPGSGLLAGGAGGSAGDPSVSTNGRLDCTDANALTGILANTINYQSLYAIGRHEEVKWGLVRALSGEGYDIAGAAGTVQRKQAIQGAGSGCYRRHCPVADPALLLGPVARGEVDGLLLTSSEGVRNLEWMLGTEGLAALRAVTVFATHPRIVAQARAAGFERVVETPAGDDGLMQALESHFA